MQTNNGQIMKNSTPKKKSNQLEIEYKQWLFITRDLYPYFFEMCSLETPKEQQEAVNVIQHWLLLINEDRKKIRYSNYPLLSKLTIDDEISQRLIDAIVEKQFFWRSARELSTNTVRKLLEMIDDRHGKYEAANIALDFSPHVSEAGEIVFGEFLCRNFDNLQLLCERHRLVDITTMALRYESLGNGSYQWGELAVLHEAYYSKYGCRYEGFASPINSRFLSLPGCRFCSLFPEIDSQFGSLGNFFDIDLANYPGGWSVDPPFVNSVLEDASKKILEALEAGIKSHFFCTYPFWTDCKGWKLLNESPFLAKVYHRKRGCLLQDAYGNIIRPPTGYSLFCLSYTSNINFEYLDKIVDNTEYIK